MQMRKKMERSTETAIMAALGTCPEEFEVLPSVEGVSVTIEVTADVDVGVVNTVSEVVEEIELYVVCERTVVQVLVTVKITTGVIRLR
jgi:hypothetical protein